MNKRHLLKMLRAMADGGTVQVARKAGTIRGLARLASVAEQFGYAYADGGIGAGPTQQLVLLLVPDTRPEAQARAARNRELYPDAADGGPLPPLVPEEVALLEARISFDFTTQFSDRQRVAIAIPLVTVLAAAPCIRFGLQSTAALAAGVVWAVIVAFMPIGIGWIRHKRAGYAARLHAAGFTPVADKSGRVRYVPPSAHPLGEPGPEAARSNEVPPGIG